MSDTLLCPNCRTEIEVSAVLATQMRQRLQKEFDAEARRKDKDIAERAESLRQRERAVEDAREAIDQEVLNRLAQERTRLLEEAREKARASMALEMQDLNEQLTEARTKLGEAQQLELQVRKERRDLETQKQELDLAVNRRLDEERNKIREETKKEAQEENRLREADQDKLIADLRRQIGDLKRKSEQGSQQAQGEVLELEIEDILRQQFPSDIIEAIPRGTLGGDVLQHVHDNLGRECGAILWESKRTKAWSDVWLPKLRDDQRAAKAHLAVLATVEMPKGLSTFGNIDGVWVTSRACLVGLAAALRAGLVEVARTRKSLEGQQSKIEFLYSYFSGPEFTQRVEGIVEAFIAMKSDLESERRCMRRLWAKREKQLDRAVANTAGLYGDLGGILGAKLPQIPQLELVPVSDDLQDPEFSKAPWE
jgi:hypothetical protein